MNIRELCVFNLALDGSDIYSVPSFSGLRMSSVMKARIITNLIGKGYFGKDRMLTDLGVQTVDTISKYKEADYYVSLNSLAIACSSNESHVGLTYNPVRDDYSFSYLDMSSCVNSLFEVYDFLHTSEEKKDRYSENISQADFEKRFELSPSRRIVLTTLSEQSEITTTEVVFVNNNQLFHYNATDSQLSSISKDSVRTLFSERMKING